MPVQSHISRPQIKWDFHRNSHAQKAPHRQKIQFSLFIFGQTPERRTRGSLGTEHIQHMKQRQNSLACRESNVTSQAAGEGFEQVSFSGGAGRTPCQSGVGDQGATNRQSFSTIEGPQTEEDETQESIQRRTHCLRFAV